MSYSKWLTGLSVAIAIVFAFLYFSGCGNKKVIVEDTTIKIKIDSLSHAIELKQDSIKDRDLAFNNLQSAYDILQEQKKRIIHETDTIWMPADSIRKHFYNSDSVTTIKAFNKRFGHY